MPQGEYSRVITLVSRVAACLTAVVSIALVVSTASANHVQAAEVQEQRYIFDEVFSWITPAKREKFLADVKAAGFNVIVPVVWRGKGVSWPSSLAPRDPDWSESAGADPLKDLIVRAHELGMKVVPWFTVSHRLRNFFPEFHGPGTPDQAFNIHDEGFRTFIVQLMMEVVDRYDIDGLNLDYVRAKGICKSSACQTQYGSLTRRDLLQDADNMWKRQDSGDSIAQWNAESVTRIIEDLSAKVRARRPNLPISVDSHPIAKFTYLEGASSIAWANRGLIDIIFDMQYTKNIDVAAVNGAKSKLLDPAKYVLLVGNYEMSTTDTQRVWPRDASAVSELLKQSQLYSQKARAAALYEYPYLNREQIDAISRGPFNPATAALNADSPKVVAPRLSAH